MSGDSRSWVRRYIAEGWSVIPIPPREKGPRVPNWQNTTFTEEHFENADDNIGVRLGDPSGGLIDIDLDAAEAVTAARSLLLQSPRIHGRPGKPYSHYWFRCKGIKTQRFTAPNGDVLVEIRGTGGQTLLPPSVHPSGERLAWEQEREPMPVEPEVLRKSVALVATAALVSRYWPKGSRHEASGALAGFLAGAGVEPVVIERVVHVVAKIAGDEEASDRARFAGDTARRAASSADNPVTGGTKLAELIGDEPVKRLRSWFGIKSDGAVEELNAKYFQVRVGTQELVGHEGKDGPIFQKPNDLRVRFANQLVAVGEKKNGDDVLKTKFDVWLAHSRRRQFETIGFYPPPLAAPEKHYNLWRGFAFEPDSKPQPELRCSLYLKHVREVTCSGDEQHAEYLFDWMADAVQNPGRPGAVAVAMRGAAGAGKGFTARELGALFGRRHFIQLDRSEHLTGKFNAHLSGKVLVFADEAIWAGSKQDLGPLKRLITEPTLTVERKGIDATDEPNCVHLITATNEGWHVPGMMKERRWFVLDVASTVAQNHEYFNALKMQQENGGRAALLAFLMARKITSNLLAPPRTAALLEQIMLSVNPLEKWWFWRLQEGCLFDDFNPADAGDREDGEWPSFVATDSAFNYFTAYCRTQQIRTSLTEPRKFGNEWRALLPGDPKAFKKRAAVRAPGQGSAQRQPYGVTLPSLRACREAFEKSVGQPIPWNEDPKDGDLYDDSGN